MEASSEQRHRFSGIRREGERVTPLELFFDLVFVLAITQCTGLMSHDQSWSGLAQGLLILGVLLAAALWWTYFDVVALVSARRLGEAEPGRIQNELARDSYSYIHLLLVAGIVLMALGMKVTIGHHSEHLDDVPAFALLGGLALYLLGLVCFRYRHVKTLNRHRAGLAIVLLLLIPVATAVPALISLAVAVVLIWAMITFEHRGYGPGREQLRREASAA